MLENKSEARLLVSSTQSHGNQGKLGLSERYGRETGCQNNSPVFEEVPVSKEGLPQIDTSINGGNGYSPISELMRAIILRTIEDFNSGGELMQEAIAYMNGGDAGDDEDEEDEYIFSFAAICKHLGLDPAKTRFAIMNATHRISTRRRAA